MIVIPLNMWRFGYENDQFNLGTIMIYNDGTSRERMRGNYVVHVFAEGDFEKRHDGKTKPLRSGTIKDWPRISRPVFELVIAALHACNYRSRKKDESSASESAPRDGDVPEVPAGNKKA